MSYVYMKALESAPEKYDKGIRLLSWGKIDKIRNDITNFIEPNNKKILELGVGTGSQAILLAQNGGSITGLDASESMINIAKMKIKEIREQLSKNAAVNEEDKQMGEINLIHRSIAFLDELESDSFDTVTSTLMLSELTELERKYALYHINRILKPGGNAVIADEIVPSNLIKRLFHGLIHLPLKAITYMITQNSTKPVKGFADLITSAGLVIKRQKIYQIGAFQIISAQKPVRDGNMDEESFRFNPEIEPPEMNVFSRMWQTILRLAPHPTETGLIKVNNPVETSPVLATCNFKLTVYRLVEYLKKENISCYLLVCPSKGINVWCASTGDLFNTDSIITGIKTSHISEIIGDGQHNKRKRVILPQLGAPAIDTRRIKKETGWRSIWGPVSFIHLKYYLKRLDKADKADNVDKADNMDKADNVDKTDNMDNADNVDKADNMKAEMVVKADESESNDQANVIKTKSLKTESERRVTFKTFHRFEMATSIAFPVLFILAIVLIPLLYYFNMTNWILPLLLVEILYYYFVFLIWPLIPFRKGFPNVTTSSVIFMGLILLSGFLISGSNTGMDVLSRIFYLWPLLVEILLLFYIMVFDIDGMTPMLRSSFLAKTWNKGKDKAVERWGKILPVNPYGIISIDEEACIGCGNCEDVCPMLIPHLTLIENNDSGGKHDSPTSATDIKNKRVKAVLRNKEECVNCRACISQCPVHALYFKAETQRASENFRRFYGDNYPGLLQSNNM